MWGSKKSKANGPISSLIGIGTKVVGDVDFSGGLHIDGQVYGNITASEDQHAHITISESGYVVGEIHIPNVIINGTVEGDIYSSEHLELVEKARVKGNVYYNVIEMAMRLEKNEPKILSGIRSLIPVFQLHPDKAAKAVWKNKPINKKANPPSPEIISGTPAIISKQNRLIRQETTQINFLLRTFSIKYMEGICRTWINGGNAAKSPMVKFDAPSFNA